MAIQSELSKGLDKQGQTDFGSYSDITARISRIEIVLRKKKKKKKPKAEGKAPTVDDNGVIKEEFSNGEHVHAIVTRHRDEVERDRICWTHQQ